MVLESIRECSLCKHLRQRSFKGEEVHVREMRSADSLECLKRLSGLLGRCLERSKQEFILVLVHIAQDFKSGSN